MDNADPAQNLFDSEVLPSGPQGELTRYYYEASSGGLNILADYLMAPDNNGIFQLTSSTGYFPNLSEAISTVNATLGSTLSTYFHHNSIADYDNGTLTAQANLGQDRPKFIQARKILSNMIISVSYFVIAET